MDDYLKPTPSGRTRFAKAGMIRAMHPLLRYATDKQEESVELLKELVECESPSDSPASVARFVDLFIEKTRDIGRARILKNKSRGPHLRLECTLPGRKKSGQLLGLGHSDTVWPLGTLAHMPFRREQGRLRGPGTLDMKAGLVFFITACRALRDLDIAVGRKVVLLIVSDEEVGSETSRAITEAEAQKSESVLVLEPGTGLTGKLKTARKGVGNYAIRVAGKASHAGVDFESGASAIVELARQIDRIAVFTDVSRGITVNPGVISGGTRTNVIAAEALVEVDIRIAKLTQAAALHRKFQALKPVDKRCRITVEGGVNRPPMERTRAIAALFQKARILGRELGVGIEESSTGGGSDGNFTAALGIPTLDGLGAVGEGAHATHESILESRIADRTALLAMLLSRL
jgi:glutamate carboxypeptidase